MIERIDHVMKSDGVYIPPPQQLDSAESDRLHDEVVVYRALQQRKITATF